MKYVSFRDGKGQVRPGVWLDGRGVFDIQAAMNASGQILDASSLLALIQGGLPAFAELRPWIEELSQADTYLRRTGSITLTSPIPTLLRNAFCVGRNYYEHVAEGHRAQGTEVKIPGAPQFFTKATGAINGPDGDVRLDEAVTNQLDYEVELAIVLGKPGRDITRGAAFEHIFGYTIANDITARDLQRTHEQWFKGKSLDGTLPLGPWIVDAEEIGDPKSLELSLCVNGELRQQATVDMMIFDIPIIIESLSRGMTLEAGDIICTGTPSGVGYAMKPPRLLRPDDIVTCRIDRIGTLTNRIVRA